MSGPEPTPEPPSEPPSGPPPVGDDLVEWQRLDPRMLLVYPVRELVRFLPALIVLAVAGRASGGDGWLRELGVLIPVTLGVLRYLTTAFRIAAGRVELRRGLLNRHLLSTPLDRVRTVDLTASPIHRALGLVSVRIGTGTSGSDDDRIDLDGLPADRARRLRRELLELAGQEAAPGPGGRSAADAETVLRLEPGWVRFAPLTSTGLVIAAGALAAAAQLLGNLGDLGWGWSAEYVVEDASNRSVGVAVAAGVLGLLLLVSLLSIGGYLVSNWGFTLTHTESARGGAWHVRRGLLTTRETTLDDERIRGVTVAEPLGLRLARGARATAIVAGIGDESTGSAGLAPPAPRSAVERAAAAVIGASAPLTGPLRDHGPRACRRRWTRALVPASAVLAGTVVASVVADLSWWVPALTALVLPLAALLAADRARSLGHTHVDGYVVARSGTLDRRRDALEVAGVIGWNLRSTWFQRRAGLTTLAATTAGSRQAVRVLDIPEGDAVALALEAQPDLVEPFLDG